MCQSFFKGFRKNGNTYYDEDGLFLSISSFENNYTMIDKDENKLHFSPHNNIWYLNRITNNKGYTTTIKYGNLIYNLIHTLDYYLIQHHSYCKIK